MPLSLALKQKPFVACRPQSLYRLVLHRSLLSPGSPTAELLFFGSQCCALGGLWSTKPISSTVLEGLVLVGLLSFWHHICVHCFSIAVTRYLTKNSIGRRRSHRGPGKPGTRGLRQGGDRVWSQAVKLEDVLLATLPPLTGPKHMSLWGHVPLKRLFTLCVECS